MGRHDMQASVWEAVDGFVCDVGGMPVTVQPGQTAEEGNAVLVRYRAFFRPIRVDYPAEDRVEDDPRLEAATAGPGEVRP